jgi:GAF domain-containing protein
VGDRRLHGVTGPLAVVLIAIPVLAGLLGGRGAACWTVVTVALLYLAMAILGELDIVQPWEISGLTLRVITYGMFLATLVTVAFIAATFVDLAQRTLSRAQQRGQELAEASHRAEHAAQAEREAREREERAVRRLRQTVQEYSVFLERVAAGDYSARLTLDEGGHAGGEGGELLALGHRLNATVETLMAALRDLEAIQRRYVRRAWEGFAQAGLAHRGFRYQDEEVELADEAWLAPMAGAVQRKSPIADERELALPVTLRGQVIGAMGVRREEMAGWSDDDLALAQAIADQLAQTIESLRLLDETERRATREQLVGEVTARMRETLELETVLKTAASEMRRALGLEEFVVRLGTEEADGQSA